MLGSTTMSPEHRERVRELVAEGLSSRKVAEAMGVSRRMILGVVERFNLGPWCVKAGKPQRPAPSDFAEAFNRMTQRALAEHYQVNRRMIERWARRLNLTSPRAAKPAASKPVKASANVRRLPGPKAARTDVARDMSQVGRAVDYLRRYGAVYRCNERGGAVDKGGTHWRRGSAVLTDAEVIERAVRLGFDANSWRKLAA